MAKRKKVDVAAMDPGTPQMARHFKIVPRLTDNVTRAMRVLDGTEIDAMLLRDEITTMQHSTLNLLAQKMHGYGFINLKSPDFSSRVHADATVISDRKAEALRGAVKLFRKMDDHMGRHRRIKMINLVMMDKPWGRLRHQLDDLHYSIRQLDDIFTGKA